MDTRGMLAHTQYELSSKPPASTLPDHPLQPSPRNQWVLSGQGSTETFSF